VSESNILAARFYASTRNVSATALDKIFVRDLVLDCNIGVFEEEKVGTQRVRFMVEVSVYPAPGPITDDVAHIVSYDMIVAAIRKVIAVGHINLLETLAERVAAECLTERRAAKVRVLVEKLDRLESASLGVEIERTQAATDFHR
jgi:7,8-dihydroneopterin aldolase/epimerase/oxygenase